MRMTVLKPCITVYKKVKIKKFIIFTIIFRMNYRTRLNGGLKPSKVGLPWMGERGAGGNGNHSLF